MKQLKILFTLLLLIAVSSCDNEDIKAKGLIVYYDSVYYEPDTILLNIECYNIDQDKDLMIITPNSQCWRVIAKDVRFCKPIY